MIRTSTLRVRSSPTRSNCPSCSGLTTFVNPAAARMLGWPAKELIGKPMHALLHHTRPDGSAFPREECPIYAAFRDGKTYTVDDEDSGVKTAPAFRWSTSVRRSETTATCAAPSWSFAT